LLRAWREVGFEGQPQITAPSLKTLLEFLRSKRISSKHIRFAQAGGGKHAGIIVQDACFFDIVLTEEQITDLHKHGPSAETCKLTTFVEASCMFVDGTPISRLELIQYVANKLGGTHFQPQRKTSKSGGRKSAILDQIRGTVKVADKNAVYYELLSIGQSLVQSEDIGKLQRKLEEILA
jgi:hypothetical protein